MKIYLKIIGVALIAVIFNSCTLELQEPFDFQPENTFADPFQNMTAWEHIQTRTSGGLVDDQGRKRLDGEELDYMIAAIKRVGYEDLYNQTSTERTYLLLNNNAFTGGNRDRDILRVITGRTQSPAARVDADEVMAAITSEEQLNMLKAVLKYHIVTEKVAQVPKLTIFDKNFVFKTILPALTLDVNGLPTGLSNSSTEIVFRRNIEWKMEVNPISSPLISTAVGPGFNEKVRSHNYVFNNGIGHYLNDPVRYHPIPFYENYNVD